MTLPLNEKTLLESQLTCGVNFERRTVYLVGEVESEMSRRFITALETLDATNGEIRIVINSMGGEEPSGYAIHDAITMTKNRVIIEGYGEVSSIAAAIFQAGDLRRLSPNAFFMVHNGSAPSEESMKQDSVISLAARLEKDNQRYYDILSASSQHGLEQIKEWCKDETHFTAMEAVEAGFADEIIPPIKNKTPIKKSKRKRSK